MGSFGEKMQREREMRSINLDEIVESTKISARMLRALEEEEFDKLPGGIFNRGFVRAYARYLGLDEEQAVADYLTAEVAYEQKNREDANQDQSKLSAQMNSRNVEAENVYNIRASADSTAEPQPDQAAGLMMASIIVVVVLGVGGFAWKYLSVRAASTAASAAPISEPATGQQSPPVQSPAPQPVQPTLDTSVPVATNAAATEKVEPQKDTAENSAESPAKNNLNVVETAAASELKPELKKDKSAQTTEETLTAAPGKFSLEVRATEQSWVQVKADGAVSWEGVLSASSNKSFRANKELVIKLGNAAGVELSYNGKALPRFASDTKTKTLTFTSDGLSSR